MDLLSEIAARRGQARTSGGIAINMLELFGAAMVEATAFEPDAATYRSGYYYNAAINRLFKRIVIERRRDGVIKAYWRAVSG